MTCIIGMISNHGRIYLAADSCVRSGDDYSRTDEDKIYLKKNMIFAVSGNTRVGQLFLLTVRRLTADEIAQQQNPEYFIYEVLLPNFQETLDKAKCFDSEGNYQGQVLLGFAGKIWTIGSDLSILFISTGFAAIGSGAPYAKGVLQHMILDAEPYDLELLDETRACLKHALLVSSLLNSGVCEPFYVEVLEPLKSIGQAVHEIGEAVGPFVNDDEVDSDGDSSHIEGADGNVDTIVHTGDS